MMDFMYCKSLSSRFYYENVRYITVESMYMESSRLLTNKLRSDNILHYPCGVNLIVPATCHAAARAVLLLCQYQRPVQSVKATRRCNEASGFAQHHTADLSIQTCTMKGQGCVSFCGRPIFSSLDLSWSHDSGPRQLGIPASAYCPGGESTSLILNDDAGWI